MAEEKALDELTPQDRRRYHRIDLYDDKESVSVEDRKWMPPFVARDHPASEFRILCVSVPSCDGAMASARAKLGIV